MVDPELFESYYVEDMVQERHAKLIAQLDRALNGFSALDFAVTLFGIMGYAHRERVTCTRLDLPFLVGGEHTRASTDVCIVDSSPNNIRPVVLEDKGGSTSTFTCSIARVSTGRGVGLINWIQI